MISNVLSRKTSAYVKLIAQATIFLTSAFASLAFSAIHTPSSEAQIAVTSQRSGVCYTGRYRQPCYFPSANGLYSNVRSIQITGGSGATVTWQSYVPVNWTGGWNGGAVLTFDGKTFIPSGQSSCVIGFPQYGQSSVCQNPYRGSQRFVRVVVQPHNSNWQTNFKLIPD